MSVLGSDARAGALGVTVHAIRSLVPARRLRAVLVGALLAVPAAAGTPGPAAATALPALTRYPYLTDAVQDSTTVSWATESTAGAHTGAVRWGPAGSCDLPEASLTATAATATPILVGTRPELQWTATLPTVPDTSSCYRVTLDGVDLLGTDPAPTFTSQVAAGSTAPFSFAVLGDWGRVYAGSQNADQARVLQQVAGSGVRFVVLTGDTAYQSGNQLEYGDLQQTGDSVSGVFGPQMWALPGRSVPLFNVTGNHGFTRGDVQTVVWPEGRAAATSGGHYQLDDVPSVNGTAPGRYPGFWYAFDAGPARLYALTGAWDDGNLGTGTDYQADALAHWAPTSPQYRWLEADLAAHPNAVKLAFWHYPLYSDSTSHPSDTSLQGRAGSLQGLLDRYRVRVAFNGHSHGYQRNAPDAAGLVSYVFGNGGAGPAGVGPCRPPDVYALGTGGTACGSAPTGLTDDHVYGFGKVTVSPDRITVTPVDELGRSFDEQVYPATVPATGDVVGPSQPGALTAAPGADRVALRWTPSTDDVGVTGYRVYRDLVGAPPGSTPLALPGPAATGYTDLGLPAGTGYTYRVSAVDAAGNESTRASVTVSTQVPTGSLSFAATADATVDAANPGLNAGSAARLVADGSPVNQALLAFAPVLPAGCVVASASLRLTVGTTAGDESAYGGDLYPTGTGWAESTVTWTGAPAATGPRLSAATGAVRLGQVVDLDATAAVSAVAAAGGGPVGLLLRSPNGDGVRYVSRETPLPAQAPTLTVGCAGTPPPDLAAPSAPGALRVAATAATRVDLAWTASTDDVGVTGYRVYRDLSPGVPSVLPLATVPASATGYSDLAAAPATSYLYRVTAVDAAGHESAAASVAALTPAAPPPVTSFTVVASQDATIDASQPTVPAGAGTRLTVDASPVNQALVRFDVTLPAGCRVSGARLRMTVGGTTGDESVAGGEVFATTSGWSQGTVTWATAPAATGPRLAAVPGAVARGASYLFDVTPAVTATGPVSLLLRSPSTDGARYVATEARVPAQAPTLLITC
jgi:fibronectin type 3 domain-containing protein